MGTARSQNIAFPKLAVFLLLEKMNNYKWVITEFRMKIQTEQKKLQENKKEPIVGSLGAYYF